MNWQVFVEVLVGSVGWVGMTLAIYACVFAAIRGRTRTAIAYGSVVIVLLSALCGWMASP